MIGIGTDIESVIRFERLLALKSTMLQKLFTECEFSYAMTKAAPAQTLAGIWCAKEAVVKAVGAVELLDIRSVHIRYLECGKPVTNAVAGLTIDISIAHTQDYATAVAIAYK